MRELSLHILDVAENSISAGADMVRILVQEARNRNLLRIRIRDNGRGIPVDVLDQATNPFYTTRTTRKVGLGLPLLDSAARRCGGDLELQSVPGKGTCVTATFLYDHIDRAPLGDLASTLVTLIIGHRNVDFIYHHVVNRQHFFLNTRTFRDELDLSGAMFMELSQLIRNAIDGLIISQNQDGNEKSSRSRRANLKE